MHCYLYLKFQGMILPWEDINLRLKYIIKNNESFITKKKTFPFCVAILKLNVSQTVVQKIIGLFCTMQDVKLWQQSAFIINKKKSFFLSFMLINNFTVCAVEIARITLFLTAWIILFLQFFAHYFINCYFLFTPSNGIW